MSTCVARFSLYVCFVRKLKKWSKIGKNENVFTYSSFLCFKGVFLKFTLIPTIAIIKSNTVQKNWPSRPTILSVVGRQKQGDKNASILMKYQLIEPEMASSVFSKIYINIFFSCKKVVNGILKKSQVKNNYGLLLPKPQPCFFSF